MSTIKLVGQLLDKVYKAKAVLLYFRGVSLRDVQKYLSDEDYHVSIEAIRK